MRRVGRRIVHCDPKGALFSQGDSADSVFYLQSGRVKVTVVSANGKEATITLLFAGDFIGENRLPEPPGHRSATVTAITPSYAMKITRSEMIRVMHDEHAFSDLFLSHLLARSMRTQEDLVDQLFNSSEKRLARLLLLMAEYGEPGEPTKFIPPITQETLAEMVGTTRSRVSFFMNRFRKLGFIDYNGRIQVHKSLLKAVLLDRLPEQNSLPQRIAPKLEISHVQSTCQAPCIETKTLQYDLANAELHFFAARKTIQAPSHVVFSVLGGGVAFRGMIPISMDLR
jgi:CRP/FNR family cyclic AMP-dependent transcriptional regulator